MIRKNSAARTFLCLLLAFVFAASCLPQTIFATTDKKTVTTWPEGPENNSGAVCLLDADTGAVLYDKNMDEQRKEIAVIAPTAARKTFLINDFANMCVYCKEQGYMEGNTRQEKLESVIDNASMIRPMIPDTNNVEDPIGKDFAVYQAAYNEICKALQTIASATV